VRKRIINKLKGFTLVEILIGVAAAGVIGSILVAFLTQNSRIYTHQNTKVNQGMELNTAFAEIEETIKSGGSVVSQYPATGQATHTTGLNTLVISVPSINAQGAVLQNSYDYVVLYPDAKILRKKVFPDAASSREQVDTVLSTKLSKLEFKYYDSAGQIISPVQSAKIGFIINVSDSIATETESSSASGQVNLRNN
jgi:prepilin-type N-terminal cleavage/methylation domain-containing protein